MVVLNVPIHMPYAPDFLLGPSAVINSVHYNIFLHSTAYVENMVPNTVLGSIVWIKNKVLGSKSRNINTVPVD